MSIPELATIASHGLPIKIIVMNNGYLGMVRQWQTLFYNNRLSAVELDCFPDAEKLAGGLRLQGPHHREALGAGAGAGRGRRRAGPVSAERQGVAVRIRLSDGAGRRRDQRDGAGAAAAGGGARPSEARNRYAANDFLTCSKTSPAR